MQCTKLHELADFGQSIWLDNISRSMIESGKLRNWIERGLRGLTSNPSIFNQAISHSREYDRMIADLRAAGKSTFEIYDELTIRDIRDAADLFTPVYQASDGLDGYVSLEINPELADDTAASIQEGKRLFAKVGRPNLMIKVPATDAGFPVVSELLASGINVNVTLIFSRQQYRRTVQAYFEGVRKFTSLHSGTSRNRIRSVASVFVSRVDTAADKMIANRLADIQDETQRRSLAQLTGQAAQANCRLILEAWRELFSDASAIRHMAVQRVLWGSTSTKNPDYSDIKYVSELIACPTVNTVPEKTLLAFLDHGTVAPALRQDVRQAEDILHALHAHGISVDRICDQLLIDGVEAFQKAFGQLLAAIETKARQLCSSS